MSRSASLKSARRRLHTLSIKHKKIKDELADERYQMATYLGNTTEFGMKALGQLVDIHFKEDETDMRSIHAKDVLWGMIKYAERLGLIEWHDPSKTFRLC